MDDLPEPPPDFSRPLEALKACRQRIRQQCAALRHLVGHMRSNGCDAQAREVAAAVIRYFENAARLHHEDEEDDLLPRMMAVSTVARGSRLTRLIADIAGEHREMERQWTAMRAALQEISAGENIPLDPLNVDRFAKLYHAHIVMEEANVYPLAEMLLSPSELAEIGTGMAQRRGLPRG